VTRRRGRRSKKLLGDLTEKKGYWKLKEGALYHTMRRTRSGRGYGPVVRHKQNDATTTRNGLRPFISFFRPTLALLSYCHE